MRVLAAGLWTVTLVFALRSFTPDRDAVLPFSSDDAISVIMANDTAVTPFHLYYFGQDRFGAWPHLMLAAASRVFGTVTPTTFSRAQIVWAWLGAIPLWQLAGACGPGALVAYLWALTVASPLVGYLFAFQPYTWQIAALLWAWWLLRRIADAPRIRATPTLIALGAALLPVWTSRASAPMLFAIATIETVRARRMRFGFAALDVAPVAVTAAAAAGEWLLRQLHGRYARLHFGDDFRTRITMGWFHLDDVAAAIASVVSLPPGILSCVATVFGLVAIVTWGVARVRRGPYRDWEASAVLSGGFALVVAAQFGIAVSASWVRLNSFNPRYFVLCAVFAALILGVFASAILNRLLPGSRAFVLVIGFFLFLGGRPAVHAADQFAAARRAGLALSGARHGAILWGDYWATYLIAGAAPEAALRPVPFDGQANRTPWLNGAFVTSDVVIASFQFTDRFGNPSAPIRVLVDRGQVYEFAESVLAGTWPFALYRRRTDARATVDVEDDGSGAAALFDGRPQTTYSPGTMTLRYRCPRGSTVDVLGGAATLERWLAGIWNPLSVTYPRHWNIPAAPQGQTRLRLTATDALSEVIVLCDTVGRDPASSSPEQ